MNKIKDAKTEYDKYLEDGESAPASVIKAYRAIGTALDDYISELSEFSWICGFNYALRLMERGDQNA